MFLSGLFDTIIVADLVTYFIVGCLVGAVFKFIFEGATLYETKGLFFLRAVLWSWYFAVIFSHTNNVGLLKNVEWGWIPVKDYSYNEYMLTMGVFWLPKLIFVVFEWFSVLFYILINMYKIMRGISD